MDEKNIVLERKTEGFNVFCAVRAMLQLGDFNVKVPTCRQFAVRRGFHYKSRLSFPVSLQNINRKNIDTLFWSVECKNLVKTMKHRVLGMSIFKHPELEFGCQVSA